jgi:hypothetical protein
MPVQRRWRIDWNNWRSWTWRQIMNKYRPQWSSRTSLRGHGENYLSTGGPIWGPVSRHRVPPTAKEMDPRTVDLPCHFCTAQWTWSTGTRQRLCCKMSPKGQILARRL